MATKDEKDAVSKLMGQYLLKGFSLLDDYCAECRVMPMMKSKNQNAFCVYCKDVKKIKTPEKTPTTSVASTATLGENSKVVSSSKISPSNSAVDDSIDAVVGAISQKLLWSSNLLHVSNDLDVIRQLNELVIALLQTLKYAKDFKNSK